MVYSKFNQQTGILETDFTEDVTLVEIVNDIISTKENKIYPRLLKIKTNASKSNFKFSIDDLETIEIENGKLSEKYDFISHAIVVDSPKTTMLAMLYQGLKKNDKYRFNIFSTDKGASVWLENY